MNEHKQLLTKWLKILMYAHIVSIAASVVSLLPVNDTWNTWVNMGVNLVVTACMFSIAPANPRYKTAGILRAVYLALMLLNITALSFAGSIMSLVAVYQEYSAHSELMAEPDPKLSRNWHSLFNWQIIVGLVTAVVSMIGTMVLIAAEMDVSSIVTIITGTVMLVQMALEVVYFLYVRKMIGYFAEA